jgi:hypothetical protein
MSKILRNNTGSDITITDVGSVVIPTAGPSTYTIPPQDYLLWAQSSDILTYLNDASPTPSITVTDGSFDLNPSDGVDLIKGIHPRLNIQNPLLNTLSLPLANTEGSFALPAFTRFLLVQNRNTGLVKLAFIMGDTSGTDYLTIWPGNFVQYSLNVESPLTLYMQSPKASQVIEINHWT